MAPIFLGGKLKLKGSKKNKKTKHSIRSSSGNDKPKDDKVLEKPLKLDSSDTDSGDEELTETEKKALQLQKAREKKEMERLAQQSHRERVEEFNEKLGSLTEHNDIPRVSAAGNG